MFIKTQITDLPHSVVLYSSNDLFPILRKKFFDHQIFAVYTDVQV